MRDFGVSASRARVPDTIPILNEYVKNIIKLVFLISKAKTCFRSFLLVVQLLHQHKMSLKIKFIKEMQSRIEKTRHKHYLGNNLKVLTGKFSNSKFLNKISGKKYYIINLMIQGNLITEL